MVVEKMATALEVAKYIINAFPVDNLKLQKLLYYSQAVYLVKNNKQPLFADDIEAWDYGPVVPAVYRAYKACGIETIPPHEDPNTLNLQQMRAVDMTLACFGEMSGVVLINQTHREPPWKEAFKPGRPSQVISVESLYKYFKGSLKITDD
jgi:uncharacterized phage-associated protein